MIASYDKALEFKPNDHDAWNNRGTALAELGRYEEVIASYDKALEFKPDDHEAWNGRGAALYCLKRYKEAVASFNKAIKVKPDFETGWYWNNRGLALFALGHKEEAIASYDKALQIQPNFATAYYNKACYYSTRKNINLAISTLKQAINLDSKYREMAKTDSDFDGIRQDDRFRSLLDPNLDS